MKNDVKKLIVILGILVGLTVNVSAKASDFRQAANLEYYFHQTIATTTEGYNLSTANKIRGSINAVVQVNETLADRATNFIVIDSNGNQKAENVIILGFGEGSMRFYNQMFEGTVILRANTGGTAAKYTVVGVWSPNR